MTSLLRRTPAASAVEGSEKSRHLGWLMLTALGIGATIGAGIFVMPGRIAQYAGPAGILSFIITGFIFLFVGICYEKFARVVPQGVSAYSYVYHSIGEIFAWVVAFGLFLEYSFGASAVAVGWSAYLDRIVDVRLPAFWRGPVVSPVEIDLGRELGVFALVGEGKDGASKLRVETKKGAEKEIPLGPAGSQIPDGLLSAPALGEDSHGIFVIDHSLGKQGPDPYQPKDAPSTKMVALTGTTLNGQQLISNQKVYINPTDEIVAGADAVHWKLAQEDATADPARNKVAWKITSVAGTKLEPGKQLTIGTSGTDVVIKDNETVDAKHAIIEQDEKGITYVTDLGSKNKTFVDGVDLKPNVKKKLDGSSKLRVGNKEEFHFGVNLVSLCVVAVVTVILIFGGVQKSAKLNFCLVCLKSAMLLVFMAAGLQHMNFSNWQPFMPKGFEGVLQGAAIAVFPYVGFDALYTFARESKSHKDTSKATYWCIGLVAFLYVAVMAIATAMQPVFPNGPDADPNPLFVGTEASAPLANLLIASGENWAGTLIAYGAVIGIFNVLLVLSMGGPRIFRNMAEDGLLPPIFAVTKNGNPTFGLIVNGLIVGSVASLVPFEAVTDIMVLGTLVAFIFVSIGAVRLRLVHPIVGIIGAVGCGTLAFMLGPLVWKVYAVTCPVGLVIYFLYGRNHSKLRQSSVD